MSQNPAHSHRRALPPPAVTRFQLRTASASEAVFAAPFVAPRRGSAGYTARRPLHAFTYVLSSALTPDMNAAQKPRSVTPPVFSRSPTAARKPVAAGTRPEPRRTWHMPGPGATPLQQRAPRTDGNPGDAEAIPSLESEAPATGFPLNGLVIPDRAVHFPAGDIEQISADVADQLQELSRRIRHDGITALGHSRTADELARVIAALLTGYLSRDA